MGHVVQLLDIKNVGDFHEPIDYMGTAMQNLSFLRLISSTKHLKHIGFQLFL
jgi:hypothetical protein